MQQHRDRHGPDAARNRGKGAGDLLDGVEIHVADEGPGFPDTISGTAFERFTRGDPARTSSGAGLGLAIVKAVVEAHGGSVALSPDAARGADVMLTLPSSSVPARRVEAVRSA